MTLTKAQIEENLNRAPNREERKVLLVTDDNASESVYCIKIAQICTVLKASNMVEVLEHLPSVEMVLVTIGNEALPSFQLFTTLRQNPATSHLPIVVLDKGPDLAKHVPSSALAARRIIEMKAMPEGHAPPPYFALVDVVQRVSHMMGWN